MDDAVENRFLKARAERQQRVQAVLQSTSRKKIVVAGPGTGKTFLFKEILKGKPNSLTLTFVNSLVEDLSLDLCGSSEVRTLHGFARSIMAKVTNGVKVYPKLSKVISEDAEILKDIKIDFDSIFNNREDQNEYIPFYKRRKKFYKYYGFTDLIYAAVLYLELKAERIPTFDQVLIDEFQDFNRLEVSLIDLLASKSQIAIAGDDDQSLYYFKDASPIHIRERYSDENKEYESFNLPHCSRCTRVIVDAVNDVVASAKAEGLLKGRIDKPYVFFDDEKKEADCKRYPKLTHVTCFATQVPFFVAKSIREIAEDRKEKFSVLIIAPTKARCRKIVSALKGKGFENINYVDGGKDSDPSMLDALSLLAADSKCNFGWRIMARLILPDGEFIEALRKEEDIRPLIDGDMQSKVDALISAFKKIANGQTINEEQTQKLLAALNWDSQKLIQETLHSRIEPYLASKASDPATRQIPIKVTTIPSSKGLADDYVFIADFDDRFFLEKGGECSDQKVFDFLVALTRARRKIFLMSSEAKEPKLLTWIAKDRIEKVKL